VLQRVEPMASISVLKKDTISFVILVLFLWYWASLQKENDKAIILEGATALQATTLEAHIRSMNRSTLLLTKLGENSRRWGWLLWNSRQSLQHLPLCCLKLRTSNFGVSLWWCNK
jgi:hypothetical protein